MPCFFSSISHLFMSPWFVEESSDKYSLEARNSVTMHIEYSMCLKMLFRYWNRFFTWYKNSMIYCDIYISISMVQHISLPSHTAFSTNFFFLFSRDITDTIMKPPKRCIGCHIHFITSVLLASGIFFKKNSWKLVTTIFFRWSKKHRSTTEAWEIWFFSHPDNT